MNGSRCVKFRVIALTVRSPGPASSLSLPEGATSLPPGLITSLHTCAPTHHFTPHTCIPTHHFTPHTCAPTHHSQLFPMCGLFMHLSPVPLPAEITFTSTHMCMFVFHCVYYLTDYIRFHALGTPALRCHLGCPVLDFCFCLLAFDLIK